MAYVTLADLMAKGLTIEARCPRCSGKVTVPTKVYIRNRIPQRPYSPDAQCHRCGVTFAWHSKRNPTGSTAIRHEDKGLINVWFCDRVLDAPAPRVIKVKQ